MLLKVKAEKLYLCFGTIHNLAKNDLPISRMACGSGGPEPVLVSICFLNVRSTERRGSVEAFFVFVCVHGRSLVYVDISVYTRVCPISWAQSTVFAKSFGVCCLGKRNLPPACIST